ncbi:MAG: sigma 54-interacting transcriptional regulator [Candidatus Krumholzibacteriota bacterium]|nr:sigma 54-interacting transcriptional regulator [Candidatus Krumholzibacteriota bacterium]
MITGACRYYLGQNESAREALESALGLTTFSEDPRAKSKILIMLGLVAQSMGFISKAEDYFSRGREICSAKGDFYGEAAALLNISLTYYHRGWFARAEKSVKRAKSLFVKAEWDLGVCRAMLVQGNIRMKQGEYDPARKLYSDAFKIADRLGFQREQALSRGLVGLVYLERRDFVKAVKVFTESLHQADRIAPGGDISIEMRRRLGEVFAMERKHKEASDYLEVALSLVKNTGDLLEEGLIKRALAINKSIQGNSDLACGYFNDAIECLRNSGSTYELARTHLIYARLLTGELLSPGEIYLINPGKNQRQGGYQENPGIEPDNIDKALSLLMEAGHLFSTTDADHLRFITDRLIEKLIVTKKRNGLIPRHSSNTDEIITISHSNEYMIAENLAAVSEQMFEIWRKIRFAATFSRPVLITGETGTGKELVAKLIHDSSPRADKPFMAVNCAAIPDHLFESEFFGHRKGCFTGALTDRRGIFEEADGGSIFLDEIGELSTLEQVKLLRVLQERKVKRVGENSERFIDVRIISATNRFLEEMIAESTFRDDFYYRINAETIHIEPLRKRPEDIIPLLTWRLSSNGNSEQFNPEIHIESSALRLLQQYHWPGNVRELISVIDRIAHLNAGGVIQSNMLPERIRNGGGPVSQVNRECDITICDRDMSIKLNKVLNICRGNKSAAAKWLGISRGTFYKQLRQAGLGHFIR